MPGATIYPFVVSTLTWESRAGQWNLSVCVKATFSLGPLQEGGPPPTGAAGEPELASQRDGSHEDVLFDQAPLSSLYSPSDFVPYKPHVDVLLVGHAHAPGGVPVDSLVVRLRVGDFSKALRVTGDRVWVDTPHGRRASAPRPFNRMPLRYERAWSKGENVAGVAGGDTSRPPPNIDVLMEESPAGCPGFGPIAPSWRARRDPLSQEALIWGQRLRSSPRQGPVPVGVDPAVFNCAPRDQQIAEIAPGASIVLDNLHPRLPLLSTRLPSVRPVVFHVDPAGGPPREVAARIDTLWIDTDREVFVVSWRGVAGIASPEAAGRVLVAAHAPGQVVTFDEVDALVRGAERASDSPARRAPPKTASLPQVPHPAGAPFPLAGPASSPAPAAAPIAGAPWAAVPAAPVPRPGNHLEGTLPLGASLAQMVLPRPAGEGTARAARKAAVTIVGQQMPPGGVSPAPFPLAGPAPAGSAREAEPIAGAPWTGLPAAPVPRPDHHLDGTMPLGTSLTDVVAKVLKAASVPAPAPIAAAPSAEEDPLVVVAAPASVTAPAEVVPPAVEPPPPPLPAPPPPAPPAPAQVVWRVDAPEPLPAPAPPAAPPPPPAPDKRKQVYGGFTRKR